MEDKQDEKQDDMQRKWALFKATAKEDYYSLKLVKEVAKKRGLTEEGVYSALAKRNDIIEEKIKRENKLAAMVEKEFRGYIVERFYDGEGNLGIGIYRKGASFEGCDPEILVDATKREIWVNNKRFFRKTERTAKSYEKFFGEKLSIYSFFLLL